MPKLLLITIVLSTYLFAALPPRVQNVKDLDVMVEFIKKHPAVSSSLNIIDFQNYTIHYRIDCKVIFKRKERFKPLGWAGPADPLEFHKSTCSLKY